jgi:hypothetical protein
MSPGGAFSVYRLDCFAASLLAMTILGGSSPFVIPAAASLALLAMTKKGIKALASPPNGPIMLLRRRRSSL